MFQRVLALGPATQETFSGSLLEAARRAPAVDHRAKRTETNDLWDIRPPNESDGLHEHRHDIRCCPSQGPTSRDLRELRLGVRAEKPDPKITKVDMTT